ncbi:vacuolar ATP synthase subunit C [Culex quinquefasciatus]|uniref:V-type proton ATPase subunit C n=2 Tax=Culex pipiens complex TaxID=518105 RepID=B0W3Q1_CULQU|nr:vacuolar ATP synthase subunit C [Culex quinquefasciatus]|eukprot:XP_001843335.1 vacuolar ATP synthase subunit C [Culex quinquefasciatus]
MSEYWLISAPGDKTCQQTWETMNNLTSKQNNLCENFKFHIPDLKVGTLDQLVGLSDDLGKLDAYVEQSTRKIASYLGDVLEDQRDKLYENLQANNNEVDPDEIQFCNSPSSQNNSCEQLQRQRSCVDDCSHGTNSPSCCCSQKTRSSASGSERDADSLACVYPRSGSVIDSPVTIEVTEQTSNISGHDVQTKSSNGPSISFGSRKRSYSINCNVLTPDAETEVDREDHESSFEWWFHRHDLTTYITRFQWDLAKYPTKQSLRNIADIISKQVGQIDADLKTKSAAYNNLKGNLQNLEKKQTGSLLTRNLADLVKREHFILDSEYLTTLLVIVPKQMINDWNVNYEKITDMIVPRSSQMITQDNDYALCTVTLFKKVVDEFKLHARERKFVVREFTYNEEELAAGKNEITKLVTDKKKQFGPLVRWLKVNFSECFCAWIHVKALRVFVESVLRYGLPVNFQAILIHPNKKNTKRLRDVLNQLYGHLDGSAASSGGNADNVDIPGLGFGQSEYYPYVYYKLNIDMVENKV